MALVAKVLTYPKQSDLFQNYQPLYDISPTIVSSTLILSASGIIFGNGTAGFTFCISSFLSIFQLILVLTYAILMVLDRTAWDRHLDAFFLGCLRIDGD